MASDSAADALVLLRASIKDGTPPIPTTSTDATSNTDAVPLEEATYVLFNTQSATDGAQHTTFETATPTRFVSQRAGAALDLLSVFFCWEKREAGVGDYLAATQALNEARTKNGLSIVTNLPFAEKLDLVNWLQDEEHDSEFIKNLDDNETTRREAQDAADVARGDGDAVMGDAADGVAATGKISQREEERMKEIYAGERRMGDRNTVLRGIKPTDFSHVRKYTDIFLKRTTTRPSGPTPVLTTISPALRNNKPSGRRPEPIIMLSPSASSLLRLSNIKPFLTDGLFTPATSNSANMLHINRTVPSIDPSRPMRFILVETSDNFKPDYWSRVVAVFTTGQAWQFKGYKWQNPAELFSHALGVYVGWRGENTPDSVKGWGRGVLSVGVDKWRENQNQQQRWRDREVVEEVWSAIEANMRSKGWGKDGR